MMNEIEKELEFERKAQTDRVMPFIGPLLDAWEALPNDVKGDEECQHLFKYIEKINQAVEGD